MVKEPIISHFPAIAIEGDQALTVLYIDRHNRLAIRQFYFDIQDGKLKWDNADVYIDEDEKEDFKKGIDDIISKWQPKRK